MYTAPVPLGASAHPARPRAVETLLLGTLAVAALDAANAVTFWAIYKGVKPAVIFQGIAAGVLGKEAFHGGAATAWLGAFLHVVVAAGVTTIYYLACRVRPALLRWPFMSGCLYGVVVYGVMNAVVIPLSRATRGPFRWPWFLADFFGHLLLIGLPVALIARWSTRRSGASAGSV